MPKTETQQMRVRLRDDVLASLKSINPEADISDTLNDVLVNALRPGEQASQSDLNKMAGAFVSLGRLHESATDKPIKVGTPDAAMFYRSVEHFFRAILHLASKPEPLPGSHGYSRRLEILLALNGVSRETIETATLIFDPARKQTKSKGK